MLLADSVGYAYLPLCEAEKAASVAKRQYFVDNLAASDHAAISYTLQKPQVTSMASPAALASAAPTGTCVARVISPHHGNAGQI